MVACAPRASDFLTFLTFLRAVALLSPSSPPARPLQAHPIMAKDEAKKEKKSKRKSEGGVTDVGEDTAMSIDAPEKKSKKEKKEKKSKDDDDDDLEEDAVTKGEVSPEAISPIARESACASANGGPAVGTEY